MVLITYGETSFVDILASDQTNVQALSNATRAKPVSSIAQIKKLFCTKRRVHMEGSPGLNRTESP